MCLETKALASLQVILIVSRAMGNGTFYGDGLIYK